MWNERSSANAFSNERNEYIEQAITEEESIGNWLNQEFSINEWLEREEALLASTPVLQPQSFACHDQHIVKDQLHVDENTLLFHNKIPNASTSNYVASSTQQKIPRNNPFLRPCNELPPPYHQFFKFGVFNKMQSACIDDAFYSDTSLAISAPTGSGKTVLMEMAILRVFLNQDINSKIIYMAPTKSLCFQKFEEWEARFKPYTINSQLFTGDTDELSIDSLRESHIIITTPEKWDNSTRKWKDHRRFMGMIKLFLIDEVHILNEQRGAVLEACVSRMKSAQQNMRFIAVSATVPNIDDVAAWLNAKQLSFSEEYRPIQIQRFIYGYKQEENMFSFERKLAWKLLEKIQKHSDGKSTLIFCATRASCQTSCETLVLTMDRNNIYTLGQQCSEEYSFKNKLLNKFVKRGVLFHHAGLSNEDRRLVERLFSEKKVRVIATTSTLAVGVNLPAYMVIIKSTQGYQDGKLGEYTDINFLQMVGRAGRPGLDTAGCVVIMTTKEMEDHYKRLITGSENLESNLHLGLTEHLMSEIYLGTVNGIKSGLEWLFSTFLSVRSSKNPAYYKLENANTSQVSTNSSADVLSDLLAKNMDILEKNKLIVRSTDGTLTHTEYGGIMSRYYIKLETMISIINSQEHLSIKDTLILVSGSYEMGNLRINSGEKPFLNNLKKHPDIQFPLEKIVTVQDKVFIIIQCVLSSVSLYASGVALATESVDIMRNATRTTKCLIDCAIYERNPSKLKFSLQLYQSLLSKIWTNSALVLKQIRGIGQQKAKTLAQSNIVNFTQLRECDPGKIEMILHRNPPFGLEIKRAVDLIPNFILNIKQSLIPAKTQDPYHYLILNVEIKLANKEVAFSKNKLGSYCQFWVETSLNELIDFRRILISKLFKNPQNFKLKIQVQSSNMLVHCHLQSENYVGIDVHKTIDPKVDPRKYIDIAGASSLPIPTYLVTSNKENENTIKVNQDDDLFDDDIDLEQWKQLADTTAKDTIFQTTNTKTVNKTAAKQPKNQPKIQPKAKRTRKTDNSSRKSKKQKPNQSKQNEAVALQLKQPVIESFSLSVPNSKNTMPIPSKPKQNTIKPDNAILSDSRPKEKTPEIDFDDINVDEFYDEFVTVFDDAMMDSIENKQVEGKNEADLTIHATTPPLEKDKKTSLFGNFKTTDDKISDNDTVFTQDDDYYFDKTDPCCDSLIAWLERNVKIVSN